MSYVWNLSLQIILSSKNIKCDQNFPLTRQKAEFLIRGARDRKWKVGLVGTGGGCLLGSDGHPSPSNVIRCFPSLGFLPFQQDTANVEIHCLYIYVCAHWSMHAWLCVQTTQGHTCSSCLSVDRPNLPPFSPADTQIKQICCLLALIQGKADHRAAAAAGFCRRSQQFVQQIHDYSSGTEVHALPYTAHTHVPYTH